MAAVTSTIVALGGLGLSAAQAINSQKRMNDASKAAAGAVNELKNVKEFNAFKQVQVPTLGFNLAQESKAQGTAQALQSLQGAGAEGVIGGVGNIIQAGNQQDLQLAAQAQEAQFKRDAMQAEAEQGIQSRKAERDFSLGAYQLEGAQAARTAAEEARNSAIEGMFSSAAGALTSASGLIPAYKESQLNQSKTTGIQVPDEFKQKFGQVGGKEVDWAGLSSMPNNQYMEYLKQMNPEQLNMYKKILK